MKTVLTFFLTMILFPMLAFGQQGMFQYADEHAANLTAKHVELLENMQSKPKVIKTYLVTVAGISEIKSNEQLSFNLPGEDILTIRRTSVKMIKENQLHWTGDIGESTSEVNLLITKEGVTGMIRSKNYNYDIYPFRNTGFHVLVEIDPSKFERELPPLIPDETTKEKIDGQDNSGMGAFKMMADPEIRVLVGLYNKCKK